MYSEEVYEGRAQKLALIPGTAFGDTRGCTACGQGFMPREGIYAQAYDACADGQTRLCHLNSQLCSITCDQLRAKVCSDPSLFVGNDPVRLWANCGGTSPTGQGNALLYVAAGGVALIAVAAVVMATRHPRRILAPARGGA